MTHLWFWKAILGERKGQSCRVICTGKLTSALVEFGDGFRVVTSRYAVRKKRPRQMPPAGPQKITNTVGSKGGQVKR